MKTITTLLFALPLSLAAQTTWQVEVGGSTAPNSETLPYYDPSELTIHVGDIVHWHSVSGTHNVYGMHDMFPDNPEEFESGEPTSDLDYSHTFTIPGVYMYHCTQQGHAVTQHGMITVLENSSGIEEATDMGHFTLFPVPANGQLNVGLEGGALRSAEVLSMDGRVQRTVVLNGLSRATIDVDGLATGRYLLRLVDNTGRSLVRTFLKS